MAVSVAMVVAVSVHMSVAVAMTVTMLMTVSLTLRVKTDKESAEEDASSILSGVFSLSAVRRRRTFRKTLYDTPAFQKAITNFCALMIVHTIFKFSIVFKRYQ